MNNQQPFKRLLNLYSKIAATISSLGLIGHEADNLRTRMLSTYRSAGKGKGKRPRGTGHKHMAYVRASCKRRGRRA